MLLLSSNRARIIVAGLFATALACGAQQTSSPSSIQSACLPVDQVVKNLEEGNARRTAALQQFEGKRIYRMEYRGFPGDRGAEMVVHVTFRAPNSKQFRVLSESGSRFILDHIFKKLLESEQQFGDDDNRRQTALTTENYYFQLAGCENTPEGQRYILNLSPRNKNKFLYRGKIWVDGKDFAVARIEAEPERNPSLWIRKTEISHQYAKVGDFWLPAENHTVSFIRAGGKATLSIEYEDYRIKPVHHPSIAQIQGGDR